MYLEEEYYFIYKTLSNEEVLSKYRIVGRQLDELYRSKDKSAKLDLKAEQSALYKISIDRNLKDDIEKIKSINSFVSEDNSKVHIITGLIFLGVGVLLGFIVFYILSKTPFLFYGLLIFSIVLIGFAFKSFYLALINTLNKKSH